MIPVRKIVRSSFSAGIHDPGYNYALSALAGMKPRISETAEMPICR